MIILYFLIYNFIFLPLLYVSIHIVSLFHPKLRHGVLGRYGNYQRLRREERKLKGHPVMVVHCASMGEFEHIKPFLLEFRKSKPDYGIIVLFFSPSGFENVRSFAAVDLFLYTPFDWFLPVWRFMRRIKPRLWVIAKHDVWPNQVWIAHYLKIPIFLINASLHQQSSRLLWFSRPFHQAVYCQFNRILTISDADLRNFLKLAPPERLVVAGDTKYDQVVYRRDESMKKEFIPKEVFQNEWVFVAGSTWPEDQSQLIPVIKEISRRYKNLLTIICPHEPTPQHLEQIESQIHPLRCILLSDIRNYDKQQVIIVDRIGVLANLYGLGKVAYVGGSFKQNIHNVLEPAVYGIPVIFGPVNQNSHEAQLLKANHGGWEVYGKEDIKTQLEKFLVNDVYRQETGMKAFRVVESHLGATQITIESITKFLSD